MKHKYHTTPLVSFAQVECFYQPALFHWVPLINPSFCPGWVFSPTSHLFYILSRSLFVMIKIAAVYLFLRHTLMYQQLETDRLLIRPIATTDSGFILELINTPAGYNLLGIEISAIPMMLKNISRRLLTTKISFTVFLN